MKFTLEGFLKLQKLQESFTKLESLHSKETARKKGLTQIIEVLYTMSPNKGGFLSEVQGQLALADKQYADLLKHKRRIQEDTEANKKVYLPLSDCSMVFHKVRMNFVICRLSIINTKTKSCIMKKLGIKYHHIT
jgi:hypothetical protein